jgi:hypothetical protein
MAAKRAGAGTFNSANAFVSNSRFGTAANAEALARRHVHPVARHPKPRRFRHSRRHLKAPGMTSLQLLILFLAVMLVVALGAAGTFI